MVKLYTDEDHFNVIEYDGNKTKSLATVQVLEHSLDEERGDVYVVQYNDDECLPADEVVKNAYRWLNARGYNMLINNCECMATVCKTGKLMTEQVRNLFKLTGKEVGRQAAKGGVAGVAKVGHFVFGKAVGNGLKRIGTPMAVFGGVLEVGLAALEIYQAEKQYNEGNLGKKRRDAFIGRRVVTAGGDIGGGVAGMVIGSIFGPAGTIVGGIVGGLAGRLTTWGSSKIVVKVLEKHDYFED